MNFVFYMKTEASVLSLVPERRTGLSAGLPGSRRGRAGTNGRSVQASLQSDAVQVRSSRDSRGAITTGWSWRESEPSGQ